MNTEYCLRCNKPFTPKGVKGHPQRYCSATCRLSASSEKVLRDRLPSTYSILMAAASRPT